MRPLLRVLLLLAAVLLSPTAALAHASLIASEPADGAVVAESPTAVTLTFNEPVTALSVRLVGPDGPLADPVPEVAGNGLRVRLPSGLGVGSYALSYRVASEDGHPIGGALLFAVGAPSAGVVAAPPAADAVVVWLLFVARLVLHVGLLGGVGGTVFLAMFGGVGEPARRIVGVLLAAGFAALPAAFALQGLDALAGGPGLLLTPHPYHAALSTSFARTIGLAAVAFAVAGGALRLTGWARLTTAALALVLAGAALAASGHAASAPPRALTVPAVALHGIGLAVWIGALVPLAFGTVSTATLARFSRVIPFAAALVLASGATLAWIQVGDPALLLATGYGRVLLVKLGLVAVLLGIAALNRWRFTAPALAGSPGALQRAVRIEIVVVVAILAAVGLWRQTPPPRVLSAIAAEPVSIHIHTLPVMADVTVTPGRAGPVDVSLLLLTGEFGAINPKAVSVALSQPDLGVEPIERPAVRGSDGSYRVEGLALPVPGRWRIRIKVLITDFDQAVLEGHIDLRP